MRKTMFVTTHISPIFPRAISRFPKSVHKACFQLVTTKEVAKSHYRADFEDYIISLMRACMIQGIWGYKKAVIFHSHVSASGLQMVSVLEYLIHPRTCLRAYSKTTCCGRACFMIKTKGAKATSLLALCALIVDYRESALHSLYCVNELMCK
jgi:hypothetical protein